MRDHFYLLFYYYCGAMEMSFEYIHTEMETRPVIGLLCAQAGGGGAQTENACLRKWPLYSTLTPHLYPPLIDFLSPNLTYVISVR